MNKDPRPVNLDLTKFHFPITAIASITHRIAGVILFFALVFLLYGLNQSLESKESFENLIALMQSPIAKFVVWGILSALAYHFVAGIKHYCMDLGLAETAEGALIAAITTLICSATLIALAAFWVYL